MIGLLLPAASLLEVWTSWLSIMLVWGHLKVTPVNVFVDIFKTRDFTGKKELSSKRRGRKSDP